MVTATASSASTASEKRGIDRGICRGRESEKPAIYGISAVLAFPSAGTIYASAARRSRQAGRGSTDTLGRRTNGPQCEATGGTRGACRHLRVDCGGVAPDETQGVEPGHLGARPLSTDKSRWSLPWQRPIASIEASELLTVLRRLEARGVRDATHRVRAVVGRVFRYAIATSRAKHDVSMDLRGALDPRATRNHPSITDPVKVGQLLRAIEGYEGQIATLLSGTRLWNQAAVRQHAERCPAAARLFRR